MRQCIYESLRIQIICQKEFLEVTKKYYRIFDKNSNTSIKII